MDREVLSILPKISGISVLQLMHVCIYVCT